MNVNVATTNRKLLNAVTTGTSMYFDVRNFKNWAIAFQSSGTVSGGTILIEEAMWDDTGVPYGGTWSQLYSITATALTGTVQKVYHFGNDNVYGYVRVRISSDITGGATITAWLMATA